MPLEVAMAASVPSSAASLRIVPDARMRELAPRLPRSCSQMRNRHGGES